MLFTTSLFKRTNHLLRAAHARGMSSNPLRRFVSITDVEKELNFAKPFQIYMTRQNQGTFDIEVLFANEAEKKVTVLQTDSEGSIGDLIEGLRENYKLNGDLRAYSLDKKQLSEVILLTDLQKYDFYIVDLTNKTLFLVQNQDKEVDNYEEVGEFCSDLQLGYIQKSVLLDFFKRVDTISAAKEGKQVFSDSAFNSEQRVILDKKALIQSLVEALPQNKNSVKQSEDEVLQRYQQLQEKYQELSITKEEIDLKSHRQVKNKMSLFLFTLIGQFAFVGVGTYHIWSWDIVEPMAYFSTSIGLIYLSTHFFKYNQDYSNQGFYEYLKNKQANKLYAQYGFNIQEYNDINAEILNLEKKIKSALLSHF